MTGDDFTLSVMVVNTNHVLILLNVNKTTDENIIGYKIYWRETTSPVWQYERKIKKTDFFRLDGIVIDNYLFGVSSINDRGFESIQEFPSGVFRF